MSDEKAEYNNENTYIIFFWDSIKKNRGAFLNKLYGFKSKGKKYDGLLKEMNGRRLGKSCVIIPAQHKEKFIELARKHDVSTKMMEVTREEKNFQDIRLDEIRTDAFMKEVKL